MTIRYPPGERPSFTDFLLPRTWNNGLNYQGRCDGDVAEWCEAGVVRREICAFRGQTCGWVDTTVGNFCRD